MFNSVCSCTAYCITVIAQQKRPLSTKGSKHAAAATAYEWCLEGGAGRVGKGEDPRDATCLAFIVLSKQNNHEQNSYDDQENSSSPNGFADTAYSSVVRTLAGTDKGEVRSSC
jgi:hypothetical protein